MAGISFEDHLPCANLTSSWATSYDTKNWPLLTSVLTPTLHIDYSAVMGPGHCFPGMRRAEFVGMMSDAKKLGNAGVRTQHLLGGGRWERVNGEGEEEGAWGEIAAEWQLRAHHVWFKKDGGIGATATGVAVVKHYYKKVDGEWRISGVVPRVLFDEGDVRALFEKAAGGE